MEWIGDLERLFATNLYPLRVPIAIVLLIGVVVLVAVARRRRWGAAARRHPGRATALAALLLAVALPTGWYLGSPLFIRTSLVEPGLSSTPTAGPATDGPSVRPTNTPAPSATLADVRRGTFTGADDFHFGSGTASLIETAPGVWTVRFDAFSVRNGPDLYVYLSPGAAGYADGVLELGPLKATDGSYNMDVPTGVDVSTMASVVIWCKQFAVQFAVAPLS